MKKSVQAFVESRRAAALAGLALVVGVVAGLGAAALIAGIALVGDMFSAIGDEFGLGKAIALVAVPFGISATWLLAQRFPDVRGSGVPVTTAALAIRSGYLSAWSGVMKIVATSLTLGGGASAGREGPTVMIGAAAGSTIGRHSGLGEDQVRSLMAAGAGAGIGASFNAPIAGMLFALEVILGNFAIRHLNTVVIASVTAAVTTRSLVGEGRLLTASPHEVGDPWELVLFAVLGVLAAGVAFLFLRAFDQVHAPSRILTARPWLRPLVLGVPIAVIIAIEPRVGGTGQGFIEGLIGESVPTIAWWVLMILIGLKILATVGTIGSHGSGGHFMPALFMGSALGTALALLIDPIWPVSTIDSGAFAVVGMAAMFAAVARAPLTAILIVFELTGNYEMVLPLMLATSIATLIGDRIHKESVYTIPLAARGIRLIATSDIDLLDTVRVGDVMAAVDAVATATMTTGDVDAMLDRNHHHGVPVVGADDRLVGMITLRDIERTGGPSYDVTVGDAMSPHPITVTPSTPVSRALERMASLDVGRIPVVADDDPERIVGLFRRETAVKAYHHALAAVTEADLQRKRWRLWAAPDADFFDFHVPPGSTADGRTVRDVEWPSTCTLVAVRRGAAVLVPDGDTILEAGDIITGFGPVAAREGVVTALRLPAESGREDG